MRSEENGLTWYPVEIRGQEMAYGDYVQLNIDRTNYLNMPHQISTGKNVIFFSNKNNELKELKGTVKSVHKNSMIIVLTCDELPDWAYEGKLGVNLQFDAQSYEQMEKALEIVINAKENRCEELREIFLAKRKPGLKQLMKVLFFRN